VLVDDTAKSHTSVTDEAFRYWLGIIALLGGRSPVVIYQNEKGGRSRALDETGIKDRFGGVTAIHRGDLQLQSGADTLRDAIETLAQQLPHVGEKIPAKWVAIRAQIETEALRRPYISQQDYFDIYARHLELDRAKALHLSRYLHDIGVFLHFQDDALLRRTVILQNRWATEAVFTMLDDETVKARLGRFTLADCERLWAAPAYTDMHPELLGLMEKFELCYRLADRDTWLLPQLLAPSRPRSLDDWDAPGDLVRIYRYTFMPKGLISRLMVRLHRYVLRPEMGWASGVLFERGETQLLAQISRSGDAIELRARGPEKSPLLTVVASDLDAINARFSGLETKLDILIPCICTRCAASTSPWLFEQKLLMRRRDANMGAVECELSYTRVDVLQLLEGAEQRRLPVWHSARDEQDDGAAGPAAAGSARLKTIRIFLASAAELAEDREDFDLYFQRQNERYVANGLRLAIVHCGDHLAALSSTRKQDDYNRSVRDSDVFVSLFRSNAGEYTREEFRVAHAEFKKRGRPHIYTYFRNADISIKHADLERLASLKAFQRELSELGHFHNEYENTEDLKLQFRDQLDKLIAEHRL
jgi:internalin A